MLVLPIEGVEITSTASPVKKAISRQEIVERFNGIDIKANGIRERSRYCDTLR